MVRTGCVPVRTECVRGCVPMHNYLISVHKVMAGRIGLYWLVNGLYGFCSGRAVRVAGHIASVRFIDCKRFNVHGRDWAVKWCEHTSRAGGSCRQLIRFWVGLSIAKVNGVDLADRSGRCGGAPPPTRSAAVRASGESHCALAGRLHYG